MFKLKVSNDIKSSAQEKPNTYHICEQAKFSLSNKVLKKRASNKKKREKVKSCDIRKYVRHDMDRARCAIKNEYFTDSD